MITLTKSADIEAAFLATSKHGGAQATSRKLPGQYEQENLQEWAEHCEIKGVPAKIFYMLENHEAEVENAEDVPCDFRHVNKIEVAEKDDDGNYETL